MSTPKAAAAPPATSPTGDKDGANRCFLQDEVTLGVFRPPQGFGMYIYRSPEQDGYLIDRVDEHSYARSLGLKAGDIITSVNGKMVAHWSNDKIVQALKDESLDTITVRSLVAELPNSSAAKAIENAQHLSSA